MNPTIDEAAIKSPTSEIQASENTEANAPAVPTGNPKTIRNLVYLRGTVRGYRQVADEHNRTHNLITITTVNPLRDGTAGTELVDVILGSDRHAAALMAGVEVGQQAIIHAEYRSFRRNSGKDSEFGHILYAKEIIPSPSGGITSLLPPEPDRNEAMFTGSIRFLRQPVEKRRFMVIGLRTDTVDEGNAIASYPVIGLAADIFDTFMGSKEQFKVGDNIGLACHMEFREDESRHMQMKFVAHGVFSVDADFNSSLIPVKHRRYPLHNGKAAPRTIVTRPSAMEDLKHPVVPETPVVSASVSPIMESAREQAMQALEAEDETL